MIEREEVVFRVSALVVGASLFGFVACAEHIDEGTSHRSVIPADSSDANTSSSDANTSSVASGCVPPPTPPEEDPIALIRAAAETCATVRRDSTFSQPGGMVGSDVDGKAKLVGRWLVCGTGTFQAEPHAGVEFGANGRFQLLDADSTGALKANPAVRGRYYLLGSGQMGLRRDDDLGNPISGVSFSPDAQALVFDGTDSVYARTTPAPDNGRSNVPSTTNGTCSLVGAWDTETADISAGGKAISLEFGASGDFTAEDPSAASACSTVAMYGTYRLSSRVFEITQNVGMGHCQFWFDAGYTITFEAGCARARLVNAWDNCTGGRGYLNGSSVLVRRK
jgi:hypothetical protein